MASLLFVTWDGGGNVPPVLGLARALSTRGHTVRFVGHTRQEQGIRAAGFEFVNGAHARAFSAHEPHSTLDMFATLTDAGLARDMLSALDAQPADLVVVDCMLFGALKAIERAGVPFAVIEHFFDAYYERGMLGGPLGFALRLARMHPRRALDAAALRLVLSIPDLDPIATPSANLRQVGPVIDVAPTYAPDAHTNRKDTILVSLSTFAHRGMEGAIDRIVRAASSVSSRVVVTTGPVLPESAVPRLPGVVVHRFVPHVELMPEARLFIGHGGHGSSMLALAHDVPALLLPLEPMSDQPLVAQRVERAGAGRALALSTSREQIEPVIRALFEDGPHRAAAARLGVALRAMRGAELGADAIQTVVALPRAHRAPPSGESHVVA